MATIAVPLVFMIVGALIYALASKPQVARMGELAFFRRHLLARPRAERSRVPLLAAAQLRVLRRKPRVLAPEPWKLVAAAATSNTASMRLDEPRRGRQVCT